MQPRSHPANAPCKNQKVREIEMQESAETARIYHLGRIVDAAAEMFLERGYEGSSTAEIARRAKVSKRELYSNFSDKREILAAVIIELQARIQAEANVSWSSDEDLRTVLRKAGIAILKFIHSEKFEKLFRIVAAESFRDPVPAEKFYLLGPGQGRENTAAFIKRHIKAGNLRRVDPHRAADDYLDLVISSRQLTAIVLGQNHEAPRARTHVNHAVDIFLNYYGTRKVAGQARRRARKHS
jgi:TetR/AcrR family transcriptional repressor of mexJK operon